MKKYFKLFLLLILFFGIKDKVLSYSFESVEDTVTGNIFCGPYYNYKNDNINIAGGNVIFLKFVSGSDDVKYYYVNSLNSLTGVVAKGNNYRKAIKKAKDSETNFTISSCDACPLYISTSSLNEFNSVDDISFYMMDDNKGSGEIFSLITDDQLLKCDYKFKYGNHDQVYDFYYSDFNGKSLIIPDIKNNDYTGDALFNSNLAIEWKNNGISVSNGMCPTYVGNANLKKDYGSDKIYEFDYNNLKKGSTAGKYSCGGLCDFYNDYLSNIKSDYYNATNCDKSVDEYCDSVFLEDAEFNIKNINEGCSQIYSRVNADEGCAIKCLNFTDTLKELKEYYGINDNDAECGMSSRIIKFIANVIRWIKYIAPVLAIILGILDFIKAIASQNDDEMKKAQGKFVKRLIAAALLFIVPFILEFVLDKFNVAKDNTFCNLI